MTQTTISRSVTSLLVLACTFGRAANFQSAQSASPQFRSSAHVVLLDVTVTDAADRAVTDLTEKDFTILEDGARQKIDTFESPGMHVIPVQEKKNAEPDISLRFEENLPVTVLVLDELNTHYKDLAFARFKLGKFLEAEPEPMPQPTALVLLGQTRLEMISDYSRDPKALLRALKALPASLSWMMMQGGTHGETERLQTTLNALDEIASANSYRYGRKNIVWIGSGFRLFARAMLFEKTTRDTAMAAIKQATQRLQQAHVTLYTIDPSGLQVDSDGHAEVMASDGTIIFAPTDPASGDLVFEALAPATGGKIFRTRNDVDTEIATSVADGTTYYTISYSPSNHNWDGKFRRIRVELSRPRLKVRTREGYYATEADPATDSPDQALAEAVKNPIPYEGIAVKPEIVKISHHPTSAQVTLGIDRHGLSWNLMPDGRRHCEITAIRAELSAEGDVLGYLTAQKDVFIDKGTDIQFQRSLNAPVLFTMLTDVPEKTIRIRFVILDTASGRIGTADIGLNQAAEEQAIGASK